MYIYSLFLSFVISCCRLFSLSLSPHPSLCLSVCRTLSHSHSLFRSPSLSLSFSTRQARAVKWLGRIAVGPQQAKSFFFQKDYKLIPRGQTFEAFDAARVAPIMVGTGAGKIG